MNKNTAFKRRNHNHVKLTYLVKEGEKQSIPGKHHPDLNWMTKKEERKLRGGSKVEIFGLTVLRILVI